jgi:hypothetical protein
MPNTLYWRPVSKPPHCPEFPLVSVPHTNEPPLPAASLRAILASEDTLPLEHDFLLYTDDGIGGLGHM